MHKRRFLKASVLGAIAGIGAGPAQVAAQNAPKTTQGPTLLTVTGLIGAGNRGPFDPALDQMMAKQKLAFARAHAFDFAALTALPAITIGPTLEYDNKAHALKGPLLMDVVKAAGAAVDERTALFLRAVDGYAAHITAAEAARRRFIVATHFDGRPMALGGLGPLWAVYDADRFPDMAARPVAERFASCPWATYHIEVKQG
jgi:hypothetical protein